MSAELQKKVELPLEEPEAEMERSKSKKTHPVVRLSLRFAAFTLFATAAGCGPAEANSQPEDNPAMPPDGVSGVPSETVTEKAPTPLPAIEPTSQNTVEATSVPLEEIPATQVPDELVAKYSTFESLVLALGSGNLKDVQTVDIVTEGSVAGGVGLKGFLGSDEVEDYEAGIYAAVVARIAQHAEDGENSFIIPALLANDVSKLRELYPDAEFTIRQGRDIPFEPGRINLGVKGGRFGISLVSSIMTEAGNVLWLWPVDANGKVIPFTGVNPDMVFDSSEISYKFVPASEDTQGGSWFIDTPTGEYIVKLDANGNPVAILAPNADFGRLDTVWVEITPSVEVGAAYYESLPGFPEVGRIDFSGVDDNAPEIENPHARVVLPYGSDLPVIKDGLTTLFELVEDPETGSLNWQRTQEGEYYEVAVAMKVLVQESREQIIQYYNACPKPNRLIEPTYSGGVGPDRTEVNAQFVCEMPYSDGYGTDGTLILFADENGLPMVVWGGGVIGGQSLINFLLNNESVQDLQGAFTLGDVISFIIYDDPASFAKYDLYTYLRNKSHSYVVLKLTAGSSDTLFVPSSAWFEGN